MSKEILELFRPEIEEIEKKAEETGKKETKKEIAIKLYQMKLTILHCISPIPVSRSMV